MTNSSSSAARSPVLTASAKRASSWAVSCGVHPAGSACALRVTTIGSATDVEVRETAATSAATAIVTTCIEWRGPDSNRRHHGFQPCALPAELPRRGDPVIGAQCSPALGRLTAYRKADAIRHVPPPSSTSGRRCFDELLALARRERLVHRLADRAGSAGCRRGRGSFSHGHRLARPDLGLELQADRMEAGLLRRARAGRARRSRASGRCPEAGSRRRPRGSSRRSPGSR